MLDDPTRPRVLREQPRPVALRCEPQANGLPRHRDDRDPGQAIAGQPAQVEHPVRFDDLLVAANTPPMTIAEVAALEEFHRYRVRVERDQLIDETARPGHP